MKDSPNPNVPATSDRPGRNLWPYAIVTWFVVFASSLAAWITFTLHQPTDLVRTDYYEEEVHYQGQLDRLNRTAAVRDQIRVEYDAPTAGVRVQLPPGHGETHPAGRISFYRPSDSAHDFHLPLQVDAQAVHRSSGVRLLGGLWKIRVEWSVAGKEFYFEHSLVADESPAVAKLTPAPAAR